MDKLSCGSTVFDRRSGKWIVLLDKIQTEGLDSDTYWLACNDTDITKSAFMIVCERDLFHRDETQKEEAWTYWKLFYGRKNIDTEFGQYIKCGDCGFEMPFEWSALGLTSGDVNLPKECPHCYLPVRIDQTCGGVKRG